jgi:translation initiation factor 3 subunit G
VQDKPAAPPVEAPSTSTKGKYVPPFMKDSQKAGASGSRGGRDDTAAIRISNLPESMVESDLEELVKKIGPHSKMYLARDKNTGMCKGFAYVHFKNRNDAATAIDVLNGFGYDHLILNVEWSKPQN